MSILLFILFGHPSTKMAQTVSRAPLIPLLISTRDLQPLPRSLSKKQLIDLTILSFGQRIFPAGEFQCFEWEKYKNWLVPTDSNYTCRLQHTSLPHLYLTQSTLLPQHRANEPTLKPTFIQSPKTTVTFYNPRSCQLCPSVCRPKRIPFCKHTVKDDPY